MRVRTLSQDVDLPWVTYAFLTSDLRVRITGRSRLSLHCHRCSTAEVLVIRVPRWGRAPAVGPVAIVNAWLADHEHGTTEAGRRAMARKVRADVHKLRLFVGQA